MGVRKLKQVEAIGSDDLVLPNGVVICKDNCHYAPTITRGVVSVARLVDNGFIQRFIDYGISVSKNDVFYFNAISSNGIYEIDMSNLVPNINSIYNISNKRVKHNLDSTYLWHCRLAHISKKRIEKLHHDGLLKSSDDESFDKCVSCLSGKMTRKLFPHHPERATDLLGLIHTDVCGPLRHVSRQGASYFIIFTDDYSRYGYIYLLKHKHEVFKNEVENQLGKTIKLTPPYTSQHNGVSERRNCTLLNMVRSMMNLITLPLSFWNYALESAARILNMVPTKKVDKTPYELWYGKVPNLSYLKETMGYYFYFPPENKIVVARYAEFFNTNLLSQEVSGRAGELEELQDEDTSPSEITSKISMEVEGFESPHEEEAPVRRSARTHRAPECLCLDVKAEKHSLGVLNEPANYKAAMLDLESNKWLNAMNAEIQFMKDNQVWRLVIFLLIIYKDRSKRLIGLSQCAYMDKILRRSKMDTSKHGYIPMQERLDLNKTQGASTAREVTLMQNVPYASAVDSIIYVVRCTRPDVAFTQNIASHFQQNPREPHWTAMKTFLNEIKSQTSYVFILNGRRSRLEKLQAKYYCNVATKAEYIAASKAEMKVVCIRKFISRLGIVPIINEPIKMFCDNSAALLIANEPGNGVRMLETLVGLKVVDALKLGQQVIVLRLKYFWPKCLIVRVVWEFFVELLWIFVREKMSRDVITVGSTMRIPLFYRGKYSHWRERFMNYLEEQTDGKAMINSIQNGDQPLPVIAQVSLAGTTQNAPPTLKDLKFWTAEEKKTRKIDRLAISLLIQGLPNDNYILIDSNITAKDLWDALERQTKNLMDINIDALYNILKQNQGDVNDALGYKKKAVVVNSDPLALVAEKTKVNKRKEKVVVSSDSEGSGADDFS
nr:hypothetical protein [Tanacetum cinerariifolium]GEV86442.1 hypothetical protein [Tanacetum cinerariifolium]